MPNRLDGDHDASHNETPTPAEDALDATITRARSGDESAVRHLYRNLQPRLLNYLRAMVGETDAEDIASETWSRIARDLRTFHGNKKEFQAWAVTIARHRAIDHIRRQRPTIPLAPQHLPHQPAHEDTERDAINNIDTASALATIAALPHDQAQAILLRMVIGLDTATTARILGKRPGAIRTAVYRGLRNLAKPLRPLTTDGKGDHNTPLQPPSAAWRRCSHVTATEPHSKHASRPNQ